MCVVLASKVQPLWHLCGDENPPRYELFGNFGALVLRYMLIDRNIKKICEFMCVGLWLCMLPATTLPKKSSLGFTVVKSFDLHWSSSVLTAAIYKFKP